MRKLVFAVMALFVVFTLLRAYADTRPAEGFAGIEKAQAEILRP